MRANYMDITTILSHTNQCSIGFEARCNDVHAKRVQHLFLVKPYTNGAMGTEMRPGSAQPRLAPTKTGGPLLLQQLLLALGKVTSSSVHIALQLAVSQYRPRTQAADYTSSLPLVHESRNTERQCEVQTLQIQL